jgi:Zn finger protein HypA/HybF involved in hydrogenase expression
MICQLTGKLHQLFWMRSAWWCADCRQKIESCCEGGGCPSIAEVQVAVTEGRAAEIAERALAEAR